jgi:polysaccharide export outer membrane protein
MRTRWLAPTTWLVLLLAATSCGCQTEGRWLDPDALDTGLRPNGGQFAERPGFRPVGYDSREELTPPHAADATPAPGCGAPGLVGGPVPDLPLPTEKAKAAHPAYIVEPPDILLIQPVRLVPKPPYVVEPLDVLQIVVAEALPNEPVNGPFVVSPDGMVSLGFGYGVVRVAGLTIEQAAVAVRTQLKNFIKDLQVSVSLLQFRGAQQTAGEHLVGQDGTITLGSYGSVFVTGLTLCQAKLAIERHLSQYLLNPEISLSVNAYNSKVYYVVTDGAGFGQSVQRLPITGNETVLDAIAFVGGLAPVSSRRRIWVARPGPAGAPCYKILPVDWEAVVMGGDTTTNWQLFPGDRIFISPDPLIKIDNTLAKIIAPVERLLGVTLLGASTVQTINGRAFNGTNGVIIRLADKLTPLRTKPRRRNLSPIPHVSHPSFFWRFPSFAPIITTRTADGEGTRRGGREGENMNRWTLAVAALLVALAARPASAQALGQYTPPYNPYGRPPLSPYLNLSRGGIPAVNYYGLVRPQLQTERFIQQQEILASQAPPAVPQAAVYTTGHPTRFMRYSQYFLSTGGGAPIFGTQTVIGPATATVGTAPRLFGVR